MRAVCSAGLTSDQVMWLTQLSPKSQGCRSSVLFQMVETKAPAPATASTTGRQFGASLVSIASASLPLVRASSDLTSDSDFSEEPSLIRLTSASAFLPRLAVKASPPETISFQ